MKKTGIALLSAAVLAITSAASASSGLFGTAEAADTTNSTYNYGEALQKSMFFYEVQQSGPLADWNQVSWRSDAMMTDYVKGGWFDAGDHIKFALTNAYASVMMAWGLLEYEDGLEESGLLDLYRNNLQYAFDFLVGCDLGDKVVYQIGEIDFDHVWWGSAEVYMRKYKLKYGKDTREYYTTTDSNVTGEMAAALAAGYLVFKDYKPDLAKTYLEHAENCFELADKTRADGNTPASDAMYKSSHFWDELFWAANWMYKATGDQKYLDLCKNDYIPNLGKESQSTELKYTWGMCWDDVQQGGTWLYAENTGDKQWIEQAKKHLEYWTTGYGGKQIDHTPDGLPWLTQWGSLRHATTTAFLAYVAADKFFADDPTYSKKYTDFATNVMNYAFGDNDLGMSYVVGMGDKYPQAWHHRTSSGAWNDKWSNIGQTEGEDAKPHAHTLYGALVGGPDQTGGYSDKIGDYQYTEVAIDYNAGYTAALCAMVQKYGGSSDPDFPPTETPKWTEFFMRASINQAAGSYTEIKAFAMNHSAWPARVIQNLSYNYYFDISELVDAGYSIDDVSVRIGYDQHASDEGKMTISDPIHYKDNIYYVKLSFADGSVVMPTGQSEHRSECQFRISIPDNIQGVWDASNDYSFQSLTQGGEDAMVDTPYITMYDGDTLIWGTEPDGTTPDDTPVTTTTTTATTTTTTTTTTTVTTTAETTEETTAETTAPATTTASSTTPATEVTTAVTTETSAIIDPDIFYGDVDLDGAVSLTDAILLNKYLAGMVVLSDTARANANCYLDQDNNLNEDDTTYLMRFVVRLIDDLPYIPE